MRWTSRLSLAALLAASGAMLACGTGQAVRSRDRRWYQDSHPLPSEGVRNLRAAVRADAKLVQYARFLAIREDDGSLVVEGALPSNELKESLRALEIRVGGDRVVDRVIVAGMKK